MIITRMDIRINQVSFAKITITVFARVLAFLFLCLVSCSQHKVASVVPPVTVVDADHGMQVSVAMQTDSIQLGDQVQLVVRANFPQGSVVFFPDFEEGLVPGIEIVKAFKADTLKGNNKGTTVVERQYLITSFDSGRHALPAFPLMVASADNTMDTVYFKLPFSLKVGTIALAADFKPYGIKDVQSYPSEWWKLALLIMALVVTLSLVLWKVLGRGKIKNLLPLQNKPAPSPAVVAIASLQKLKAEKIWQRGQTKEYYTQLTDIVRLYIESSTGMPALEKTSEEILRMLPDTGFELENLDEYLQVLFYHADLAKFAKHIPAEADNERSWQMAYNFVMQSQEHTTPSE